MCILLDGIQARFPVGLYIRPFPLHMAQRIVIGIAFHRVGIVPRMDQLPHHIVGCIDAALLRAAVDLGYTAHIADIVIIGFAAKALVGLHCIGAVYCRLRAALAQNAVFAHPLGLGGNQAVARRNGLCLHRSAGVGDGSGPIDLIVLYRRLFGLHKLPAFGIPYHQLFGLQAVGIVPIRLYHTRGIHRFQQITQCIVLRLRRNIAASAL